MATKTQKSSTPKKKRLAAEVITQMLTLATSGFGLVAALAWNGVVQELVNNYVKKFLPKNSGLISLLIYAVIVTILAVAVTLQLTQVKERLER
jgi:hypothetical protein